MTESTNVQDVDTESRPEELRGLLRHAVRDGEWAFQSIAKEFGTSDWMLWLKLRLTNRDPFFGYSRDEREFGQSHLFNNLFRRLYHEQNVEKATVEQIADSAAEGLHYLMQELDSNLDTVRSDLLYNVFDLVGRIRVKKTSSRDGVRRILRTWIMKRYLIDKEYDGEASSELLHRCALFALAELQTQGDESDEDIWLTWFDEDSFKLAAFSGMALSAKSHPPEGWVRDVLTYADRARESGETVMEEFALRALYMGDLDPEEVMCYLWNEAQNTEAPKNTWEKLQRLLPDTDAGLLDYDEMPSFMRMMKRRASSEEQPVPAQKDGAGWSIFQQTTIL